MNKPLTRFKHVYCRINGFILPLGAAITTVQGILRTVLRFNQAQRNQFRSLSIRMSWRHWVPWHIDFST